jgi:3-phytase
MRFNCLAIAMALSLSACAGRELASTPIRVASVAASGETVPVGTGADDAADDPAIWRNRKVPAHSLIVATDKKAGLYVYGLDGKVRDFHPDGRLNNVDLIEQADGSVLVAASDRTNPTQASVRLYRLDTSAERLAPLGSVPVEAGEAYGICLWQSDEGVRVVSVLKDGRVIQQALGLGKEIRATTIRTWRLSSQAEGCVADPRNGLLYVGEEDVGIWQFKLDGPRDAEGELVAKVDSHQLFADVEGLAIAPMGEDGGILVASSQGDNAYALFRLPDMQPIGRFRIAKGDFGSTEETDGIALALGSFGPKYPAGLFVVQDGYNAPAAQNFKLVSWRDALRSVRRKGK